MGSKFHVAALAGLSATLSFGYGGAELTELVRPLHRVALSDSSIGLSGKLRGELFTYLARRPFSAKLNGRIGQYVLGFWPGERGRPVSRAYSNPTGFYEVTAENQHTQISEHFRLRDFVTKGQVGIWPKYLVLRPELVDKLELVIEDLARHGVTVTRMTVMSGFRTPAYNGPGGDGRSGVSRHMFGDAADVFVDNDGNGRMDDLNRDGRIDHRDAHVILQAVERVERRHPVLSGGVGVYRATSAHGPFAHVDVRGWRARWGLIG